MKTLKGEIMKVMKVNKRHVIICSRCNKPQSTYSTNRTQCHQCLPKCREIHTFENLKNRKKMAAQAISKENKNDN